MTREQPQQLQIVKGTRFEQVFHRDFKTCACEMPYISKKWNDALGTFTAVRLCCLAKAVEKLTGERLYEVYDFAPRWAWDCAELHGAEGADGTQTKVERGAPPRWLLERMVKKGVAVLNLPATTKHKGKGSRR